MSYDTLTLNNVNAKFNLKEFSGLVFKQFLKTSYFSDFVGKDDTSYIVERHVDRDKGALFHDYGRIQALDPDSIIGVGQSILGHAKKTKIDHFRIEVGKHANALIIDEKDYTKINEPMDVWSLYSGTLRHHFHDYLERRFAKKLTTELYPNIATQNCRAVNAIPSRDRVVLAGMNPTIADYYANANFNVKFNAANPAYDQNGPGLNMLDQLVELLLIGGHAPGRESRVIGRGSVSSYGSDKISNGDEWALFCPPKVIHKLRLDPDYKDAVLARGAFLKEQENILSGSMLRGHYRGLKIYEVPFLAEAMFESAANDHQIAHCICMGSGAMGYPNTGGVHFEMGRTNNHEDDMAISYRTFFGLDVLRFPPMTTDTQYTTLVEQGLVHLFCAVS